MKKIFIIMIIVLFSGTAKADFYHVNISRLDTNFYKENSTGIIIQTRLCLELAVMEEAVLLYEKYSYNNKLIFKNGTICDVVDIH